MSSLSAIAQGLLRESWTHLRVAFTSAQEPTHDVPRPWPIGAMVVDREGGPPRMVLGYKPDGRCMTAYITQPPWMQRSTGLRILIDDPEDLRTWEPALPAPAEPEEVA